MRIPRPSNIVDLLRRKRTILCLLVGVAACSSLSEAPRGTLVPADESAVRLYCARAAGWKGVFAVHSWIAVHEPGLDGWRVVEVVNFGRYPDENGRYIRVREREPWKRYRGGDAVLLQEIRGDSARRAIPKIWATASEYANATQYRVFPGPNSNTFVSAVLRKVPELGVELPPTAIGKDWLALPRVVSWTESGTGGQLSLWGLGGVTLGAAEGVEAHVLGLTFGIDLLRPALKLPFLGRIGLRDKPVFWR